MSVPIQAQQCTELEAYAAESATDYLDSWDNVYIFFKQYRHCYDASIAEGAEDKIQQLWANRWPSLPEMINLTNKDAEFKSFIWARIGDETFSQDTFKRFVENATQHCPEGAKEFCDAVIAEANRLQTTE